MKRHWIILLLAFVVGAACSGRRGQGLLLDKADSLVAVKPDSALRLLEHLPVRSLHTEEERARYALLLTEARDRCYVVQTDDSLIRTAVDYYDAQGDAGMRARAYYRWGSVLRDKKEQARAVEKYLEAVDLAGEAEDKGLQGKIYANLGYLYACQYLMEESDSLYLLAETLGKEVGDSLLVADALSMRGKILFEAKEYTEAKRLFLMADSVSAHLNHEGIRSNIYSFLSQIYIKENDYERALVYAKRNYALQFDTMQYYRGLVYLGDVYFRAGEYDSAEYYFERCRQAPSYISKANAYMRLSSIAQKRGNYAEALDFRKEYEACADSAKSEYQSYGVQQTITNHLLVRQQSGFKQILYAYRYMLVALIGITLLLIHIYRKRIVRITKERLRHLARLEEVRRQYKQVKQELELKAGKIAFLEKDIRDLREKEHLQEGLKDLHKRYQDLRKMINSDLDVFVKMERILQDYKEKAYSKQELSSNDWTLLAQDLDSTGRMLEMRIYYGLTEDEMHYCLLLLTDYSIGERGKIMRLSRQTPYRWEKEICRKMGIEYKAGVLKQVVSDKIRG